MHAFDDGVERPECAEGQASQRDQNESVGPDLQLDVQRGAEHRGEDGRNHERADGAEAGQGEDLC